MVEGSSSVIIINESTRGLHHSRAYSLRIRLRRDWTRGLHEGREGSEVTSEVSKEHKGISSGRPTEGVSGMTSETSYN